MKGRNVRLLASIIVVLAACFPVRNALSMPLRPDLVQTLYEQGRLDEARETPALGMPGTVLLGARGAGGQAVPETIRVVVLLVDFDDVKADTILHSQQWFEQVLFDPANPWSMRNYFLGNSYGKLVMEGEVRGWFRAKQKLSYYADGRRGLGNYPRNAQGLVEDAVAAADANVDFSQFDLTGPQGGPDGIVDFLLVAHAGQGYEWTMNTQDIHSHAGTINGKAVDGVKVISYAIEPEDGRVGTFAHEMGHLLGLPDLYDVTLNSYGLGMLSLMSYGSWGGGDGSRPVGLDAWSKARLGFLSPVALSANVTGLEIPCVEDQPYALRLWSEGGQGTQYFLVENRRAKGYDSYLASFGEGLLIYHIDERYPDNSGELRRLVYVEQADGRFDLDKQRFFGFGSDRGDPFPGTTGARAFSWWTTPDNHTNEGQPTEVSLRNIGDAGDIVVADVEVSSPVVIFENHLVDDARGDGDGEPDPGEDLKLRVRFRNEGIACSEIFAEIATADPYVVLTEPRAGLDHIPGHGLSAYVDFRMMMAEGTPQPHNAEFTIAIGATSAAGAYASIDRFVVAVPLSRLAGWPRETGDVVFSPPAVADLDKDGVKEIVLGSFDGKLYAWRANGDLLPGWPATLGALTASKPAICDVDMDGGLDVVVGTQDGKVHVVGLDGTEVPGWPQTTAGAVVSSALLADIDDDGAVEVVCGSKGGRVYAWNGDGTPAAGWPFAVNGREVWMSPAAADFDGDNLPEVVIGTYGGSLYILDGDGTPLPGWPVFFGYGCGGGSPAIADFDGDGSVEVAASGLFSNSIYMISADGKVRPGWPKWAFNCDGLSSPVPADIDGDGLPEIAVSTVCGTMVAWNADGSPCEALEVATSEVVEYCEPLFADLDGNGSMECILGTSGAATNHVFAFGTEGLVVGFPVEVQGSVWATPAVTDIEGDGHVELAVATTAGRVHLWRFVGAKPAGRTEWAQSRGDLWNTGLYGFRPLDNVPLPDLALTAGGISFEPANPRQGDEVTITVEAANIGHAEADDFTVRIYDGDVADSLVIGSASLASLGAKRDTTLEFTWKVPGSQPTRLICAGLDADNSVAERFELNNVAKQRFYLSVADLGIAIGEVGPLPVTIGESLLVHAVVANAGDDVARSFEVAFFDSIIEPSRRFASIALDSLAPGGQVAVSARYEVGRFTGDVVTLVCAADPGRNVLEYRLSNNTAQFVINSGLQGRVLAPSLAGSVNGVSLSRTALVIQPAVCACLAILRPEEPFELLFETAGSDPDICRNTVVYAADGDIAGFDVADGLPFLVSAGQDQESQPAVWGSDVVWIAENAETASLMLKRGSGTPVPVRTAAAGGISDPDLSSEMIVWEEWGEAGSDIWCYDLGLDSAFALPLADRTGDQVSPAVWGRRVAWEDRARDEGDIYVLDLDLGQETTVARLDGAQRNPAISGDIVVWQDARDGNWDIYGRGLMSGVEFPVSRQIDAQTLPAVSESTVVWIDRRGSDRRVGGLVFGGTRGVAEVRRLEALSQDALIRVSMAIDEQDDGVAYRLYRSSDSKPIPAGGSANLREYFLLAGESLHVYVDTLVAERRPYYYTLGIVDGYGEETFVGPASGQAYRRSPAEFLVGSPYPNPFRHTIDVAFGLARRVRRPEEATWPDPALEAAGVEVKVFSVTGELVRVLREGVLTPGYYRVAWDGTDSDGNDVSPGVYFVSFSAGASASTRKVVLLK